MLQRPTILLTGFGPFPGIEANASGRFVPELAASARQRFHDHDVVDAILPVIWMESPKLVCDLIADHGPAVALHFGVAKNARDVQIECTGRNQCAARVDANGALPGAELLVEHGPQTLAATFPVDRIVARLEQAGVPFSTSDDAGGYLCNALLYHSLTAAHARPKPHLAGFVHLPASLTADSASDCPLSWDDALRGGLEIIAACVEEETIA